MSERRTFVANALGIEELRARLTRFTADAFAALPKIERPRILDIGCGLGAATLELARLSAGPIVGIDIDVSALESLRARLVLAGLAERVSLVTSSLIGAVLPDESFDVLWEEGVLHLTSAPAASAECRRLLRPGGYLVAAETTSWFAGVAPHFAAAGFELVERRDWPLGCWWSEYYGPLEQRLAVFKAANEIDPDTARELARYEREVEQVRQDLSATDCSHFILRRVG